MYSPHVKIEPQHHADKLVNEGGVRIQEIGKEFQRCTPDTAVLFGHRPTATFTKFCVQVLPREDFFMGEAFVSFVLLFHSDRYSEQPVGARTLLPVFAQGRSIEANPWQVVVFVILNGMEAQLKGLMNVK